MMGRNPAGAGVDGGDVGIPIKGTIRQWKRGDRLQMAAAGLVGALLFWYRFGLGILDPTRYDWLLGRDDTAFHQLGWMFFRSESWHWPPGVIEAYMAPVGTTIGLTDSLPLLAVPFKILSFLLPTAFQYAGLWLLACHVLMAVFAVRVAGLVCASAAARFPGAGLLVLSPVFLLRDGHIALTAHWVLLAAMWLYLKPSTERRPGPSIPWLVLVAATALIHPYLAVMTFGFLLADQVRRRFVMRVVSNASFVSNVAGGAALLLSMWYLAGFFRPGQFPVGNLPPDISYAADPNAILNSQGRTALLPGLAEGSGDPFEGFNYFGAGGLLAAVAAILLGGVRQLGARLRRHWPLLLFLAIAALFALDMLPGLGGQPFRAQARFLWPLYYFLVTAGLVAIARTSYYRLGLLLPGLLLVVQVADVAPLLDRKAVYRALGFTSRLQDDQWRRALDRADLLLASPSSTAMTVFADDFIDLALLAYETGVPTTAGFAARSYQQNIRAVEGLTRDFLFGGRPDPGTVCVLRRSHFAEMYPNFVSVVRCTDLDGFPVCFAREGGFVPDREYAVATTSLGGFLAEHRDKTLVLVGKDDARRVLTREGVTVLADLGSGIAKLPVGASYVGIIVHGEVVFEQMHPRSAIEVTGPRNTRLGPLLIAREISVTSGGTEAGAYASLEVDGREVLFNREGLNVAVLDDRQQVVAVAVFAPPGSSSGLADGSEGLVFTLIAAPRR
jgi:hypothetical protein